MPTSESISATQVFEARSIAVSVLSPGSLAVRPERLRSRSSVDKTIIVIRGAHVAPFAETGFAKTQGATTRARRRSLKRSTGYPCPTRSQSDVTEPGAPEAALRRTVAAVAAELRRQPLDGEPLETRLSAWPTKRTAAKAFADRKVGGGTVPVPTPAPQPAAAPVEGYLGDITGPGITDKWGVTCTDLGVCALAPNGKLVSVFGDTFSGPSVGQGDWRAPVALIGSGDTNNQIRYE